MNLLRKRLRAVQLPLLCCLVLSAFFAATPASAIDVVGGDSGLAGGIWYDFGGDTGLVEVFPTIVAGDPNGTPPDSSGSRVDPNVLASPFGGVGSLRLTLEGEGTYICSATPIGPRTVLTAAHCLDLVGADAVIDLSPDDVQFQLNHDGDDSARITASALAIHPDYTGFNGFNFSDDVAVITLSQPLPDGTPIYPLHTSDVAAGTTFTMVGYGRSGDAVNGYTVNPSFEVKRVGYNNADSFLLDDEGSGEREVFRFDFDGPTGNGSYGGGTLGNDVETMIGGGDSGGPSFVEVDGELQIAGVNTFTYNSLPPPSFGSRGGGILVAPYIGWIQSQVVPEPSTAVLVGLGLLVSCPRRRR